MIWLWLFAFLSWLGGLAFVLLGLGAEATQGLAQKIFFFHVPAAFAMYLAVLVGAVTAIIYLVDRQIKWDLWSRAAMKMALVFGTIVLVSGPIWAKPIWGVYWTWDPRLTTSFIIFMLLVCYQFVRFYIDSQERAALVGAIIASLSLVDIPLIHFSVKIWRGVHPSVLRNPDGLPPAFRSALEFMVLATFALCILWIWIQYRIYSVEHRLKEIQEGAARA